MYQVSNYHMLLHVPVMYHFEYWYINDYENLGYRIKQGVKTNKE